MARRATRKAAAADVDTYTHPADKRKNIPTAENQKLVADEDKAVKKLKWLRNPDLDPQLVWRGKDFEPDPLVVDAPPIYIQEKIQPRAIIENLRTQTEGRRKEDAPQFDFYDDFNGLPEGWRKDATQSYYHDEGRWQNRMILGDSLLVMASLAEREALRGKVQCIYMDPPYGIRFNSNWQPSTKSRDVRDGREESISREPEVVRAFRDTWKDEIHSYLSYLRDRFVVARDLLNESGSIFVQIGDENVHLVRGLLDEVFGRSNFVCLIAFRTTSSFSARTLSRNSDYILWYARNAASIKYRALLTGKLVSDDEAGRYTRIQEADGRRRFMTTMERGAPDQIEADKAVYRHDNMYSQGRASTPQPYVFQGHRFDPWDRNSHWKPNYPIGLNRLERGAGLLYLRQSPLRMFAFTEISRLLISQTHGLTLRPGLSQKKSATWSNPIPKSLSAAS